jgi:hypothetical protein
MKTKRSSLNPRILMVATRNGLRRQRKCVTATGLVVGALCLCPAWAANAAPGSWTQKADIPAPTSTPASCVADGILYVMGGHDDRAASNALQTVWAYNPQTDMWTNRAPLPSPRHFLGQCAAVVDGMIYLVGGSGPGRPGTPVLPVAAYNPRTDTWTNLADIPTGRKVLTACAVDGIVYAIGGHDADNHPVASVEAYDPKSNQWTTKTSAPYAAGFLTASVATNGQIYVFGYTVTCAYDPKTDSWTTRSHFSPYSWGLMSAEVDGLIYLFGGFTQDWKDGHDFTLAYDPAQDQFSARRKMLRKRGTAGCGVIGGKVYLAAGVSKEPVVNPDVVYYAALDVFDPQGGVPQIVSLTCENTNCVRLRWEGEPGIWYGVESRPNVASGDWTRMMFSTGTNTVLATNSLVEASCLVPVEDPNRFLRVLESE